MKNKNKLIEYRLTINNKEDYTEEALKLRIRKLLEAREYINAAIVYHKTAVDCHLKGQTLQQRLLRDNIMQEKLLRCVEPVEIVKWDAKGAKKKKS